jgi:undecaprenyl phosphate N,N'-diacetylbacillosamine 1-phosphate transferase
MIYAEFLKRPLEALVVLPIVVICLPVLLMAAVGVRCSSPGPIVFRQSRVGRFGVPFFIFKLRTMHVNSSRVLKQTTLDDPEVFKFGKVLRRFKIDELPQLINVLLGDMSLVGPRPLMRHSYDAMPAWALRRLQVRPGITGLAQVGGNVALSLEGRWAMDVRYVENVTLLGDLMILGKTVLVLIFGEEAMVNKS